MKQPAGADYYSTCQIRLHTSLQKLLAIRQTDADASGCNTAVTLGATHTNECKRDVHIKFDYPVPTSDACQKLEQQPELAQYLQA